LPATGSRSIETLRACRQPISAEMPVIRTFRFMTPLTGNGKDLMDCSGRHAGWSRPLIGKCARTGSTSHFANEHRRRPPTALPPPAAPHWAVMTPQPLPAAGPIAAKSFAPQSAAQLAQRQRLGGQEPIRLPSRENLSIAFAQKNSAGGPVEPRGPFKWFVRLALPPTAGFRICRRGKAPARSFFPAPRRRPLGSPGPPTRTA